MKFMKESQTTKFELDFFYWDLLHARLNSHHEIWRYKKKKYKKIKASPYKELTFNSKVSVSSRHKAI